MHVEAGAVALAAGPGGENSRPRSARPDQLRRAASRALASARPTPLAAGLVAALVVSALVLDTHPADLDSVVAWASTNVHNLTRHPIAALIASVFVVPGLPSVQIVVVGVACVVLERHIGTARTLLVALSGQVLASLLTEYGADVGAQLHLWATSSADRSDVGVSYVMFSVLAASWFVVKGRARWLGLAATSAWALSMFVTSPGMTSSGHILCVLCGVATMHLVRRGRRDLTNSIAATSVKTQVARRRGGAAG